ncbi:15094_t:CDS:2, partial [Funneliformis geosporum]
MSILGRDTKYFSHDIYEDYIQEFSKKIFKSMILLDSSPLFDNSDLYFDDFVNVIYSSEAKAKTSMPILSYIFKCKLGRENITNPILLHIFWWNNASSTLSAFHLIHECPLIRDEIIMNDELAYKENFEQHIVNEVTSLMLKKLSKGEDIVELQLDIRNVLNLCENISNFKKTESFQLLHFCNDLLLNESIPLEIFKEIIEFRDEEIFTKIYIHKVFEILSNVKNIEPNKLLYAKQSFVMKSLEIIPLGSPSRLELYQTLFLENPFPLMGQIIKSIFENENKHEPFEFFVLLDNPRKMLDLPLFTIINTCVEVKGCHSSIAALFCSTKALKFMEEPYLIQENTVSSSETNQSNSAENYQIDLHVPTSRFPSLCIALSLDLCTQKRLDEEKFENGNVHSDSAGLVL